MKIIKGTELMPLEKVQFVSEKPTQSLPAGEKIFLGDFCIINEKDGKLYRLMKKSPGINCYIALEGGEGDIEIVGPYRR